MSQVYIPQDTWVVCTNQLNTGPRKLIATRMTVTVIHQRTNGFLTVEDRNIDEKFICKSPMNLVMGLAGLAVGIFLASNPIGWAVGAIALVVLASAVTIVAVTHSCTGPLKSGKWINSHIENVRFNKAIAITNKSMLQCGNNGILKPIISYEIAKKAAYEVGWNNINDVAVTTTSAIISGYILVKFSAGGTLASGLNESFGSGKALMWIGAGIGATVIMTKSQEWIMRGSSEYADNEVYQQMNKIEAGDYTKVSTYIEDNLNGVKDAGESLDPPSLEDIANITVAYKEGKILIKDKDLQTRLKELGELNNKVLRENVDAKKLLKELSDGDHPELQYAMKKSGHYSAHYLTPKGVKAGEKHLSEVNRSRGNNIKLTGLKFGLFFTPLINGYFSEQARRKLAEIAIKDVTDGINVGRQN